MEKRSKAILLLLLSAILWSSGGLFIKMVSWNPVAIAGLRSFIAMMVIVAYVRRPRFTWSVPQIGGAIAYAVTVTLFVIATKLTTAANAILLQYTAPLYVAFLGAWFLGERTRWFDWVSIAVVIGGMGLFFLDHLAPGNLLGNLLAIVSGISFAFLVLFMRKQKNESPFETIILGNLFTGLTGLPLMFGSGPDVRSWVGLLFLGVIQLGVSYVLYSKAIRHVTALEAILIPGAEPILNPIWVFIILGERPGRWALVGGLIVLIVVTLRSLIAIQRRDDAY
ncbi:MAG: DMT family transporter [Thermodesulfobacteriota bacterium]